MTDPQPPSPPAPPASRASHDPHAAGGEPVRVLVERRGEFLAFLERRVGSRALAEDILQDALVKSIDRVSTLRNDEAVVAWFYRSLRNAVVDHRRRKQTSDKALGALAREVETAAEPAVEAAPSVCQCVSRLARGLKPEYAEALQTIEVDEHPVGRFAEAHGISSNNAAVRVHRAREALRKQVTATCGECAAAGCLNCTCAQPEPELAPEPAPATAPAAAPGSPSSRVDGAKKGCGHHRV